MKLFFFYHCGLLFVSSSITLNADLIHNYQKIKKIIMKIKKKNKDNDNNNKNNNGIYF